MSSVGSRVVNFWVPRTGSRRTPTTGLVRWRAMKRMASKPAPPMRGIASTRLAMSQNQFGWKTATTLKTITLPTSTTRRNPAPHIGQKRDGGEVAEDEHDADDAFDQHELEAAAPMHRDSGEKEWQPQEDGE